VFDVEDDVLAVVPRRGGLVRQSADLDEGRHSAKIRDVFRSRGLEL